MSRLDYLIYLSEQLLVPKFLIGFYVEYKGKKKGECVHATLPSFVVLILLCTLLIAFLTCRYNNLDA